MKIDSGIYGLQRSVLLRPGGFVFLITICLFLFLNPAALSAGELAVLPYKLQSAEKSAPKKLSSEYAKLVGLAASIENERELYNPYQLQRDLKSSGINPDVLITEDELAFLAKYRMLPYIIVGTLYKTSSGYQAKSFLYSAKSGKIIARSSVSSKNLMDLAVKDASALFRFDQKAEVEKSKPVDLLVLVDTSFSMGNDLPYLQKAIAAEGNELFSYWPGSTITLIPYSIKKKAGISAVTAASLPVLKRNLQSLKSGGKSSQAAMVSAMNYGVNNGPWKSGSSRHILLLTNSSISETAALSRVITTAQARRITVSAVLFGGVDQKSYTKYFSLCERSGGAVFYPVYHQYFQDYDLKSIHLYMHKGRLYTGEAEDDVWREGFSPKSKKQLLDHPSTLSPYRLDDYFDDALKRPVAKKGVLELNAQALLDGYFSDIVIKSAGVRQKPQARVMLSSLGSSLWVDVVDTESLNLFKKYNATGTSFMLGVRLIEDSRSPSGYSFNPHSFIFGYSADYLPESIQIDLRSIVNAPYKFTEDGFMDPPLWFVDVKVEEINELHLPVDIRS